MHGAPRELNYGAMIQSLIIRIVERIPTVKTIPTSTLWRDIPIQPKWGIKKNSDGKNTFWFGFKGHLAVSTKSQYIVARLISSGNLSDSKAAIPYVKRRESEILGFDANFRPTCVREK